MTPPTFEEWIEAQPRFLTSDPVWRTEAFRIASFAQHLAWDDCVVLARDRIAVQVAPQLYRAIGSITANIAEGFSRGSGRDQARLYEYGLGSARECVCWYRSAAPVLGPAVAAERQERLQQVIRLLLTAIPRERRRSHLP